MIVVDAHQDIAWNMTAFGRDYRMPVLQTRQREVGNPYGVAMLGLPDALLGRVAIVFSTLFAEPANSTLPKLGNESFYNNSKEAYDIAMTQLDAYKRLVDADERVCLIFTQQDLDAVLATWDEDRPIGERQQGLVVLMEGADPILEPKQFEEWYEQGVRIVGPAWAGTRYSGGTGYPGSLTALGYELLEVLASYHTILDLSHMAERAYLEALDRYEGVVIASHSNPRRFRNSDRHLTDEMILRLAERDGVIGIVPYNRFLSESWLPKNPRSLVSISLVLDAIDYICQLTGSSRHVGIGSDFDGGFGAEATPEELDTVTDLWSIGKGLQARGYPEDDVSAILGRNMLRQLRASLPI